MVVCGQFLRTGESVVSEVHPYEFVLREMHCTTHYNDRPRAHIYLCLARASQAGWSRAENCVAWDCVEHLVRNDGPDDANHYALICEHSHTVFFSGWGSALREERLGLS